MTLQKIKQNVVSENQWASEKDLNKFIIRLGLMSMLLGLMLGLLCVSTLGMGYALVVFLLCVFCFSWLLDYCVESERNLQVWMKISRFWWTFIILIGITVFVLKYFRFM